MLMVGLPIIVSGIALLVYASLWSEKHDSH